ncbi:MAG: hypothetical protein IT307_09935 [Chloroflexi bacterium]|nr:hypothetical protein [Chloroflexota bacterium]
MKAPDALAQVLEEAGIEMVFGIPGGSSGLAEALHQALAGWQPFVIDVVTDREGSHREIYHP